MKRFLLMPVILGMAACSTPQPVIDTASQIAVLSNEMDRTVTAYVAGLNRAHARDKSVMQTTQHNAEPKARAFADRMQVLTLSEGETTRKLMQQLAEVSAPIDSAPAAAAITIASTPLKFDNSALQSVAKISMEIATPRSTSEQLAVVLRFAELVNNDLQTATEPDPKTPQPAQPAP